MMLRAMVLGWLDGLFTAIHERVLYPSHRLGGAGNDIWRARKPPPPLFYSVATEHPRRPLLGSSVNRGSLLLPQHVGSRLTKSLPSVSTSY